LFNLDAKFDGLLVKVSVNSFEVSLMVQLDILLGFFSMNLVSSAHKFDNFNLVLVVALIVNVKHRELNPSRKISWSYFDASLEIIPVVLGSTNNC
jgi:hypothetical protein